MGGPSYFTVQTLLIELGFTLITVLILIAQLSLFRISLRPGEQAYVWAASAAALLLILSGMAFLVAIFAAFEALVVSGDLCRPLFPT
jgi:hypothetical protein